MEVRKIIKEDRKEAIQDIEMANSKALQKATERDKKSSKDLEASVESTHNAATRDIVDQQTGATKAIQEGRDAALRERNKAVDAIRTSGQSALKDVEQSRGDACVAVTDKIANTGEYQKIANAQHVIMKFHTVLFCIFTAMG